MELRSRSRSKTPFQNEFVSSENYETSTSSSSNVIVTRSTRKSASFKTTTMSDSKPTRRSSKLFKTMSAATSDYSSAEEGAEYSETTLSHISQNEKNQIIEDAKAAANGSAEISALNLYRKAGRYWDKYPKTDYTYSLHSRDRVEIAPGVVQMPNMSRPSIHFGTNTDEEDFQGNAGVTRRLFTSTSSLDDEDYRISRTTVNTATRTTILRRILTFVSVCLYSVWNAYDSAGTYMLMKLHRLVSRTMLLDTWLLRKTSPSRKRTRTLVWLCLLPLLLFTVLWLLSSLYTSISTSSYFHPSTSQLDLNNNNNNNNKNDEKFNKMNLNQPQLPQPELNTNKKETSSELLNIDLIVEEALKKSTQKTHANLERLIAELKDEITRIKTEMASKISKTIEYERLISDYRTESSRNVAFLTQKLNRCCQKNLPLINLESSLSRTLSQLLNDPEFLAQQKGFNSYLNSIFVAKNLIETRISNLTASLREEIRVSVEAGTVAEQVLERVSKELRDYHLQSSKSNQREGTGGGEGGSLSVEEIEAMIKKSLKIYDADKTGLVDYALEPLGGQIVTTRCTETFSTGSVLTLWGLPLWFPAVSPRTVITPGIHPGECWAFQGFPGFLVIKLAYPLLVEAVSIEHVSELVVPEGKRDSAPRNFELLGLNGEDDKAPVEMGAFTYDINGDTIQYFRVGNADEVGERRKRRVFQFVEMRISSNHGNPSYTCLYRFRVHGKIYKGEMDEIL